MFRLRKMHLIYVYVPVFTLNNFFYLYLYAVMNIDRFRCISRCCLYLNTILCVGSQPFVFPAGICFALPGGEGVWRVFPGTIRTVQEHLDPGQSFGPVMSTRAVKRCILSQTVIYKGIISEILATSINVYLRCACLTYYKQPECKNSFFL